MAYDAEKRKPSELRVQPEWNPPEPSLNECLLDCIELTRGGKFLDANFRQTITKPFIKTGTYYNGSNNFVTYTTETGKNNGSMTRAPAGTVGKYPCNYGDNLDLADALFTGEPGLYDAVDLGNAKDCSEDTPDINLSLAYTSGSEDKDKDV